MSAKVENWLGQIVLLFKALKNIWKYTIQVLVKEKKKTQDSASQNVSTCIFIDSTTIGILSDNQLKLSGKCFLYLLRLR